MYLNLGIALFLVPPEIAINLVSIDLFNSINILMLHQPSGMRIGYKAIVSSANPNVVPPNVIKAYTNITSKNSSFCMSR